MKYIKIKARAENCWLSRENSERENLGAALNGAGEMVHDKKLKNITSREKFFVFIWLGVICMIFVLRPTYER